MATVARYGAPFLRHGDGTIYRGEQAAVPDAGGITLPRRRRVTLKFYGTDGLKFAEVSSEVGQQRLVGASWELLPSGCGKLQFKLGEDLPHGEITHGTRVDVHLWGVEAPIYSGFIQRRPSGLSSTWPQEYQGFGFFAQLERSIITSELYGTTEGSSAARVWEAVDHLVRTWVEPHTGVLYASGAIDRRATYRINDLRLAYTTPRRALEQLAGLAGLYEWGVGADRSFFFRPETEDVVEHYWVGVHVAESDVDEDSSKLANRLYIQLGKRSSEGDNYLPVPLEDEGSQREYGIWSATVRAPSVFNETDAYRFGSVELARRAQPVMRAPIRGLDYDGTPITCRGRVRLVGRDGTEALAKKSRVSYTVEPERIRVDVDLGDRDPARLPVWAAEVAATQAQLELIQQATNRQIA